MPRNRPTALDICVPNFHITCIDAHTPGPVDEHTDPIEVEPLELNASDTCRKSRQGELLELGNTGISARSARAPCRFAAPWANRRGRLTVELRREL